MICVILFKMGKHSDFYLSFFQSRYMTGSYSFHKTDKNNLEFIWFGGRFLKIIDVCKELKPYFKVHNLASVHPKSIILGQITNLNMISQRPGRKGPGFWKWNTSLLGVSLSISWNLKLASVPSWISELPGLFGWLITQYVAIKQLDFRGSEARWGLPYEKRRGCSTEISKRTL